MLLVFVGLLVLNHVPYFDQELIINWSDQTDALAALRRAGTEK